jgi:hypothetical protein
MADGCQENWLVRSADLRSPVNVCRSRKCLPRDWIEGYAELSADFLIHHAAHSFDLDGGPARGIEQHC